MGSVKGYLFLKKRMGLALVAFCSIICVNHGILIMNYVMIKWWVSGIQGHAVLYILAWGANVLTAISCWKVLATS